MKLLTLSFTHRNILLLNLVYFEEEGILLTLDTGFGADKTMTALSGNADIGFMGSEAVFIRIKKVNEDFAINFAQLTQRAGNFLCQPRTMIVFLGHN